jgi:uncharacterized membrane protein
MSKTNGIVKDLLISFIIGDFYMAIEGFWRGWTNISMLFVAGIAGLLIGRLNEHPAFYNRKMIDQCLIGTIIAVTIEFVSGMLLNVWGGYHIWDYSDMKYNLYGQICLLYTFFWFLLMPACIYLDDILRYILFGEQKPEGLLSNYKRLITFK